MQPIKQATDNYCFVACATSALFDEGDDKLKALIGANPIGLYRENDYERLQKLIVDRYPLQLQKGAEKEGVPATIDDMAHVLKGLGLAISIGHEQMTPLEAKELLLKNKSNARWVFVGVAPDNTHVVRLSIIDAQGVRIMDPIDGKYQFWNWEQFHFNYRSLLILNVN